jgi:hypothetical protein
MNNETFDNHFGDTYIRCISKYIETHEYPATVAGVLDFAPRDIHQQNVVGQADAKLHDVCITPRYIDRMADIHVCGYFPARSLLQSVEDISDTDTLRVSPPTVTITLKENGVSTYVGKKLPDIHLSIYIQYKIILHFSSPPSKVSIRYAASIHPPEKKFKLNERVGYNNHPIPLDKLRFDGNSLTYYRGKSLLSRSATYGICTDPPHMTELSACYFCRRDLKQLFPLWYINTPCDEFMLCDRCGETIGEQAGDDDILQCRRFDELEFIVPHFQ